MTAKLKLIGAGLGLVGLLLGGFWLRGLRADRDEALARAETAEARVATLTRANAGLQAYGRACNLAAQAQTQASAAALARREALNEIMTCPASAQAAKPAGEALNDAQNRQMVSYWNDLFAGVGVR